MEIIHYAGGKKAIGVPRNENRALQWIIRNGDKVLQQQRFGIPSGFEFPEGQSVVRFFWYWEDVPIIAQNIAIGKEARYDEKTIARYKEGEIRETI